MIATALTTARCALCDFQASARDMRRAGAAVLDHVTVAHGQIGAAILVVGLTVRLGPTRPAEYLAEPS